MTETKQNEMTVEDTLTLHNELIRGTLENLLLACEAGQQQEDQINELAGYVLDQDDRLDKVEARLHLLALSAQAIIEASRGLIEVNKGLEERISVLETALSDVKKRARVAEETVENLEGELKTVKIAQDAPSRVEKAKESFEEGRTEGRKEAARGQHVLY